MQLKKQFEVASCAAALMGLVLVSGAQAQEVYGGVGLFGVQLGYAHALSPSLTVRGDYLGLGQRSDTANESGTEYQVNLKWNRTAVLLDWFPFAKSTVRLTGGATFNQVGFDLKASGAGTSVDINNTSYTLGPNDAMHIKIKLPSTTPYLGLGWGHKQGGRGWGFHADLGVSIGQFKVTETRTGQLANGGAFGVTQTDVDQELIEVRDGVAQLKFMPQATLGLSYRF